MKQTIDVEVGDHVFSGTFEIERGMVTAYFGDRWQTTQVGASAKMTARMLIREMAANKGVDE